jgi:Holliday junction resolvase RusA-like endonuclease
MVQEIEIDQLPPSLNGKNGLLNLHWAKYQKIKKDWIWLVAFAKPEKHSGKVCITFTRKSTAPMDFDNIGASFKVVGDALEKNGIIKDDSPRTVTELLLRWEKASKRNEQGILIKIEDVE